MRVINQVNGLPSSVSANVTTAQIFPNPRLATAPAILAVPGSSRFEQRRFLVRGSGVIVTGTTTNVTITLYSGTSLTAGSNTVIKASTATAQNTATAGFSFEGQFVCESVGGSGTGTMKYFINGALVAEAAITALASLNMATEPAIQLCCGVTFSANDPANKATLTEFSVGF